MNKDKLIKTVLMCILAALFSYSLFFFRAETVELLGLAAIKSLQNMLVFSETKAEDSTTTEEATTEITTEEETTTEKVVEVIKDNADDFTLTPKDITELIKAHEKTAAKDKKDGAIAEKQYINDGVTDKFEKVRVKNVNKTKIDIESTLKRKADLSVNREKPAVLIYHTHTTETYQVLNRGFYEVGFKTRTNDKSRNMVRVGRAICEEIEKAGFKVIHDTEIHDAKYNGSYAKSRKSIEAILKKNPSIAITLDIHRDAIQLSNGTKIKPTATIKGKKAAQIMIISGCQEEGNPVKNLPDWRYNLIFALQLQKELEENFEGITRPLYFSPRSYNMNVTHNSLLVEVGSDSNTLEEAVYTGKCIGYALSEILKEYEEK